MDVPLTGREYSTDADRQVNKQTRKFITGNIMTEIQTDAEKQERGFADSEDGDQVVWTRSLDMHDKRHAYVAC